MSENTEINEDNCVLKEFELTIIDIAFKDYLKNCGEAGKEYLETENAKILQKITKLNDLAKKKKAAQLRNL